MSRRATARHHNLAPRRVRLIGREQDLTAAHKALLAAPGRLLTLTGTGGCGKTRLAVELAWSLREEFPSGVWLVELGPLSDPALVPQTLISALGLREQPGEALLVTLARALATRKLLLVLDNCEHLIEACARVVEYLLDRCPKLRVLATSREPLRITGELTWRVPSLLVPDERTAPDKLLRAPAVQLFVERAQATLQHFDPDARAPTIAAICRRLDGLPLAIELAAARVNSLSVDQILERLDDSIRLLVGGGRLAPSRQQTLRATLDWSYELLGERERSVFRRLAVFAESFTLDAAEAVCADGDVVASDVLDELQHLVDKSLVVAQERQRQVRYRLLEPLRQYAQEQLVTRNEREPARRRHALHYIGFAQARARDTIVGGPRRVTATVELDREYPNFRAVLNWATETGAAEPGLRLAGDLSLLWQFYGSTSEGLTWLAQLLSLPRADDPTPARAWALLANAWLLVLAGDFERARSCCQEGLTLARRFGEPALEWLALMFSGWTDYRSGDFAQAEQHLMQAAAGTRAAREPAIEGPSLNMLAMIACDRGDFSRAQPLAEEAVRLARANGDAWNEGWALATVGRAALGRGAPGEARIALEAGYAVASQEGQHLTALIVLTLNLLGELETVVGQLEQARAWFVTSIKLQQAGGERWEMPNSLEQLAALEAASGQAERALRLAGAGDALYERLGSRRSPDASWKLERWLVPLRKEFGVEAADTVWAEARLLGLDEAIALAIGSDNAAPPGLQVPLAPHPTTALTSREQEVAALLAAGMTNRQIAARLVVTERTAAAHVEHILNKLGFASRHQAGDWAIEHGLFN
jgi:non-specific serine/threonine protein kinase